MSFDDLTWSSSAHLLTQISENSLRPSSSSISSARFVGGGRGHEAVVLLGGRDEADDVEVDAADEDLVGAEFRGGDPQLLELGGDQGVDVIRVGLGGVLELEALGQDEDLRADGVGLEAGHDERLAAGPGGDEAVGADGGGGLVVGQEDGQRGHVAVGAVGVFGPDGHLLGRLLAVEDACLGYRSTATTLGSLAASSSGAPASIQVWRVL